ncbi:MAG: AAA family ATPase [Aerococcus sp.]|nr:AAA family ATPase [Aerococcus sp.]
MSETLQVKLFGIPTVKQGGQLITFPYAKVDALLYYLFINKAVSRGEIASMLWPNKDEAKSRKNLRNSIYQANKTLGADYILTPNRYHLKLNPDLPLTVDAWDFATAPAEHLDDYQGEFLKGFFVKDADAYEEWLLGVRTHYEQLYTKHLRAEIEATMSTEPNARVESQIQSLIALDDYNEDSYRLLMMYYQQVGLNSKVIETYYALSDHFKKDLNILPSKALTAIYKQTLDQLHTASKAPSVPKYYYVRSKAIAELENALECFQTEHQSQRVLVVGESGSGKTTLIQQVLANAHYEGTLLTLYANDYLPRLDGQIWQQFINHLLHSSPKPVSAAKKQYWRQTLTQSLTQCLTVLSKRQFLFQALAEMYGTLYGERPLVFVLEHLEDVDPLSLKLLNALVVTSPFPVLLIFSGNQYWRLLDQTMSTTVTDLGHLPTISLTPLSDYWANQYLDERLQSHLPPQDVRTEIITYAQGNLLVLETLAHQYEQQGTLTLLAPTITNMITEQLHFLSERANAILEVISFFNDGVTLDMLVALMKQPASLIKQEVDALYQKQIISEETAGNLPMIRIQHRRIRHYFYMRQPESVRRLMHHTIADTLAQAATTAPEQLNLLKVIAYHYTKANQTVQALDYELAYLQNILCLEHELFPVYQQTWHKVPLEANRYSGELISEKFQDIRSRLHTIRHQEVTGTHLIQLEIKFLYIQGRYRIRNGEYANGVANIEQMIAQARGIGEQDYLLRGYLQMIYYYIQVNQPHAMKQYVDLALELAVESNNYQYTAIVLRLRGLQFLMTGHLKKAEQALEESIHLLTLTDYVKRHFMVSLAAAYDYLAEVAFIRGDYDRARDIEEKAFAHLEQEQADSSRIVLLTNMGRIHFALKEYAAAHNALQKAYQLSNQTTSLWKRPQLLAYLAATSAKLGDMDQAKQTLRLCQAEEQAAFSENQGIYHWACVIVLNEERQHANDPYAAHSLLKNCRLAQKELTGAREAFERAMVNDLLPHHDLQTPSSTTTFQVKRS